MFQDEGRFGLLGTPRRCWAPNHMRPVVGARLERKYIYAFSAVSPHDGVMDSLVLPWVNAETMSLFLGEVAQRHAEEFIVMVMDQAGWHLAGQLTVPDNMRLIYLPAYRRFARTALPIMSSPTSMLSNAPSRQGWWRSNQITREPDR